MHSQTARRTTSAGNRRRLNESDFRKHHARRLRPTLPETLDGDRPAPFQSGVTDFGARASTKNPVALAKM